MLRGVSTFLIRLTGALSPQGGGQEGSPCQPLVSAPRKLGGWPDHHLPRGARARSPPPRSSTPSELPLCHSSALQLSLQSPDDRGTEGPGVSSSTHEAGRTPSHLQVQPPEKPGLLPNTQALLVGAAGGVPSSVPCGGTTPMGSASAPPPAARGSAHGGPTESRRPGTGTLTGRTGRPPSLTAMFAGSTGPPRLTGASSLGKEWLPQTHVWPWPTVCHCRPWCCHSSPDHMGHRGPHP